MTPEDFAAACEDCILLSTPSYKLFGTYRNFSYFNQIPLTFSQAHAQNFTGITTLAASIPIGQRA